MRWALTFAAIAAALGAEGVAVLKLAHWSAISAGAAGFLLAAHIVAAALSAEGLRLRYPSVDDDARDDSGLYWTGLLLTLLVPVFGVIAVASLAVWPPPKGVTVARAESPEIARANAMQRAADSRRAEQEFGADIESIVDALQDADPELRLGAMEALRGKECPEVVRLLQQCLDNSLFDVRFRAVEALGDISGRYSERISKGVSAVEADPEDPDVRVALADLYVEYRELGVEDEAMQTAMLVMAEKNYRRAVELGRREKPVLLSMARCLIDLGELDVAEWAVTRIRPGLADDADLLITLADIQFRRGHLRALAKTCQRALRSGNAQLGAGTQAALQYWTEATDTAEASEAVAEAGARDSI